MITIIQDYLIRLLRWLTGEPPLSPSLTPLPLSVALAALSACQTQLGDLSAGDGLVSLSRAFIYAGTPRWSPRCGAWTTLLLNS